MRTQIESLPLATLESLGEALLDFTAVSDLEQWLRNICSSIVLLIERRDSKMIPK
ncbi:MAG: DUF4351 domain-containing protein [Leptolyngbyaceae cyanobacterium]